MITISLSAKDIGQTVPGILPLCFPGRINHPLLPNPSASAEPSSQILPAAAEWGGSPKQSHGGTGRATGRASANLCPS